MQCVDIMGPDRVAHGTFFSSKFMESISEVWRAQTSDQAAMITG